jgi:hypothetical protein
MNRDAIFAVNQIVRNDLEWATVVRMPLMIICRSSMASAR